MSMPFRPEVQEQFRRAGWFPGRDVRHVFDPLPGFHAFPEFAKAFLYEYGDLEVECLDPANVGVTAILDLKGLTKGYFLTEEYLRKPRGFGGGQLMTFPLAHYLLDAAIMECDANGSIYLSGDTAGWMSTDFHKGIERVILEDHMGAVNWDEEEERWTDRTLYYAGKGLHVPE